MIQAVQSTFSSSLSYKSMQKLKEGVLQTASKAFSVAALGYGLKCAIQSNGLYLSPLPAGILAMASLTLAAVGFISSALLAPKKAKFSSLIAPAISASLLFAGVATFQLNQRPSLLDLIRIKNAVESISCAPTVIGTGISMAMLSLAKGAAKEQERETSTVLMNSEEAKEKFNEPSRFASAGARGAVAMAIGFLFSNISGSFGALVMTKQAIDFVVEARTCLKKFPPVNVTQQIATETVEAAMLAASLGAYLAAIGAVSAVYSAANFYTGVATAVGIGAYFQMKKV